MRVPPPEENGALMIRVAGRTDVLAEDQELLVFGSEADALAWIAGWLERATRG